MAYGDADAHPASAAATTTTRPSRFIPATPPSRRPFTPSFIDYRKQGDGTYPVGLSVNNNSNPFQNTELIKTPEDVFRLLGSGLASYSLVSQDRQTLDFTVSGGIDAYNDHARVISPATAYVEQVNALPGTLVNSNANIGALTGERGPRIVSLELRVQF